MGETERMTRGDFCKARAPDFGYVYFKVQDIYTWLAYGPTGNSRTGDAETPDEASEACRVAAKELLDDARKAA